MTQSGFFYVEERLSRLSGLGGQLEAFSRSVDFEALRRELKKALAYSEGSKDDPAVCRLPTFQNIHCSADPLKHFPFNLAHILLR